MSRRSTWIALGERRCAINAHRLHRQAISGRTKATIETDTNLAAITLAILENSWAIVGGHIPFTSHLIIDVLTPFRCIWTWVTAPKAELRGGHEVLPFRSDFDF
jgi:hypothetical protein